jgi:predicted metalloprotease
MAHEFAHIVDFKFGTGLSGKHKELFADYLAGCYMYFRSVEFKTTFVQEVALSFFQKGDYSFNSPQHHGTPNQRYNCLMNGYQLAYNMSMRGQHLSLQGAVNA